MAPPAVLMVGTGEYTTGFVSGAASTSDKKVGVVGLTLFDLRRRGKVSDLSMVGVSGKKFPAIRQHLQKNISEAYNGLDVSFKSFPSDSQTDPDAFRPAIDALPKGSAITIFTPDSTHFDIAKYAIERDIHVMITKPATKLLSHHIELMQLAQKHQVFVYIEHHKRFDPAYQDAKFRSRSLGDFNYFYSYMSQPKSQLETFKAWAGKESDISYYLNSHHVDICEWLVRDSAWRPATVRASASVGISETVGCVKGTEDTITLLVDWTRSTDNKRATGIYTASWTAPMNAGVHSQQHFHYIASKGEVNVNQAKRGYEVVDENDISGSALKWYNPFYMRYAPDEQGNFNGQSGYGYVSFEKFIDGVTGVNEGKISLEDLDKRGLPTLANTVYTTAILEAGRRSLDEHGRSVEIVGEGGDIKLK
ncbi:oxidoreductase [Exophiala aquamarina CBS 119918]|uniref:Oxidoreductase n=1 Tax=Exophiala aquamarina CBS 119918 TaxID=1182545 RepID=A0A072PFA0_9EURO|nr:oxidoreductase [Exophiala aquamarina CBS 119918]KEF58556.1 oxidoreductase [Exophiala aquamarina CBS 119918]